ncbi:MAG: transketolase [Pirellulales bacterium]|nr:transketolase [Pirellulales bacterium]
MNREGAEVTTVAGAESSDIVRNLTRWTRLLRYDTLRMISNADSGHPGGCMSMAEILTCLYFEVMRVDPRRPDWADRDRFILSKGHGAPILYAALARKGFFPVEELKSLRKIGSFLHGHPDISAPGVDMTTGCLGQGLSAGVGMALAGRHDRRDYRVFVVIGCGEMNEGQLWEGAASASHFHLDQITVVLDYNKLQFDGAVDEVCAPGDVRGRWQSLGWNVLEIDGHDIPQILGSLRQANECRGKPTIIIAHTIKGKGVDFMENAFLWHSLMDNGLLTKYVERMQHELNSDPDRFYAQCLW